jgi:hypothetical protein
MGKEGEFTIGTDQEMFAVKEHDYVSAIPLIKGTKEDPEKLPNGGNIQHDNVAIEFAIDPANSKVDFIQKVGNALQDVMDYLPEDVDVDIIPSATFPDKELEHPEAKRAGCDPDFNAYTRERNKPPQGFAKQSLRSCGGHIHTGYVKGSGNDFLNSELGKIHAVKMYDLFHGVVSTLLDTEKPAFRRRELYGKPGCHRLTDYGFEYRTLSNFWIRSPETVALIYSLTNDVLYLIREKLSVPLLKGISSEKVQEVITNGDVPGAMLMVRGCLLHNMSLSTRTLLDLCFFNVINYKPENEWKLY